jgi:hypothetical protein
MRLAVKGSIRPCDEISVHHMHQMILPTSCLLHIQDSRYTDLELRTDTQVVNTVEVALSN